MIASLCDEQSPHLTPGPLAYKISPRPLSFFSSFPLFSLVSRFLVAYHLFDLFIELIVTKRDFFFESHVSVNVFISTTCFFFPLVHCKKKYIHIRD